MMSSSHTAVGMSGTAAKLFSNTDGILGLQAGETQTITCITCGMPSSLEWSQKVSVHPDPSSSTKSYYPFISDLTPPQGSVLHEDGSTYLCAFCHASLETQWLNYEKSSSPVPSKDRQYNTHYFICAVCCVKTYRKRVRALPFQEFPFLLKDRQPGSITLGDNPLAVVCLDCSETMWAQSAEYDRWGLPTQKRHFNWMARPPPPEDSMEATVARLPSGETQLPRISPIVQTFAIDPRKPNSVMSSLAQQKAKLKSNKAEGNKRNSKETKKVTGTAPHLHVSLPSQVPIVTVAPMSSHRSNSTILEGNTSVTSNLTSSSALPKHFPVTTCSMQAYNQSEVPANLGTVGFIGPPLYSFPGYNPYGWPGKEIENFSYLANRRPPSWNWLVPPQHPSDMIRYQSYLSSLENRSFESSLPTHVLHPGNIGSPPLECSPPPPAHPPFNIPPPFLAPEFRNCNKNTSPIHLARSSSDDEISCHMSKFQRKHNISSSSESSIHQPENGSTTKLSSHLKSLTQNMSVSDKGASPTSESRPMKVLRDDTGLQKSAERENNIKPSSATNRSSPTTLGERVCSPAINRKLLPKKRRYNFEEECTKGKEAAEPMDCSALRCTESSTLISVPKSTTTESTTTSLPVDLSVESRTVEMSKIPSNFKIAYLCNQSGSSEKVTASISPSPRLRDDTSRVLLRESVIVNTVHEEENPCKRIHKSLDGNVTCKSYKMISTQDKDPSFFATDKMLICKPKERKKSEESALVMSASMKSLVNNDELVNSTKKLEQDVICGSLINSREYENTKTAKSEEEVEEFINETLKVFKRDERVRNILEEREVLRKIEFLKTLDLITLQDKSEVDLRKLISRHDRSTLPPLKLRPESPQKSPLPDETFEKQIIRATLDDATCKQTVLNNDQLEFMNQLKLKPASRTEKSRREHDWRLMLLEKKLREKRDVRAKGVRKPWDCAVDLSKLLLQTRNLKMKRRSNSLTLGKLQGVVESPKVLKTINSIRDFNHTTERTRKSSMKLYGMKSIINYPKYIPTYSIPNNTTEDVNIIHAGDTQNLGEPSAPNCDIITGGLSYSTSDANKQMNPGNERQVSTICVPGISTLNSVGLSQTSAMASGRLGEFKCNSPDTEEVKQDSDLTFSDPIIQSNIEPSSVSCITAPSLVTRLNGETKQPSKVGPIIQGYNASWLKTKLDIEEILISDKHLDKKSRKMTAYEIKRLRKALLFHQFEIKSLEKKLKIREREIQDELGAAGRKLKDNKARLG